MESGRLFKQKGEKFNNFNIVTYLQKTKIIQYANI